MAGYPASTVDFSKKKPFIISRVVYVAPYLKLTSNRGNLDAMIRATAKQALGLPAKASTERLLQLWIHNTVEELIQAHRRSQIAPLSGTGASREVLRDLDLAQLPANKCRVGIPKAWKNALAIKLLLPQNMNLEYN